MCGCYVRCTVRHLDWSQGVWGCQILDPQSEGWLDTDGVAARLRVSARTITTYTSRTRGKVARGEPLSASDMPLPDGRIGRSPWWKPDTIERLLEARRTAKGVAARPLAWVEVEPTQLRKGERIRIGDGPMMYLQTLPLVAPSGIHVRTSRKRRSTGSPQLIKQGVPVMALRARG